MKISFDVFCNQLKSYYQYMGRDKNPDSNTKDQWFRKIQGYQETEIIEGFEKMKDSLDSVPFNIPKALKNAVVAINMSKCALNLEWHKYGPCEDCNGSGGFRILYFDKFGSRSTPVQYCSQCDNWRNYCNDPGQRISANELSGMGYKFKPLNRVLIISPKQAIGSGSVKQIQDIANASTKRI